MKLNKRQLIAAELLGTGYRPSRVAKKLSLRRETISRWQAKKEFREVKEKAYLQVLFNILNEASLLMDKSHQALLEVFGDGKTSKVAKANIGLRYLGLAGAQSNAYEKNNKIFLNLSKQKSNNEINVKWFVDILEGISDLKHSLNEVTHQDLRQKVIDLFELSRKMPEE